MQGKLHREVKIYKNHEYAWLFLNVALKFILMPVSMWRKSVADPWQSINRCIARHRYSRMVFKIKTYSTSQINLWTLFRKCLFLEDHYHLIQPDK